MGKISEYLTQRSDEMLEVADNLVMVKKYLRENCPSAGQYTGKGLNKEYNNEMV